MSMQAASSTGDQIATLQSVATQALASSINDTATTVASIPDFTPYLDPLDSPAAAYADLPTPKSKVLTDAEASITDLLDKISSVRGCAVCLLGLTLLVMCRP
jgi:hypothetical protein